MEFTVDNGGVQLACHMYGGPDGADSATPLVCVHGACVDSSFYDGIAHRLSRYFRVITYDRRGSGESSAAADDRYDLTTQASDLAAVIEHVGVPCNILAHSAGTLVTLELLGSRPELIHNVVLHEPAVTGEGVGLGTDPKLVELIETGKTSHALIGFLTVMGDGDPRAPRSTDAEARHLMRDGRTFMAHEYIDVMSYEPRWEQAAATHKAIAVGLGDLSLDTPRAAGAHAAAERLGCSVVAFPGAHNGLRDLPREAAWIVRGLLEGESSAE